MSVRGLIEVGHLIKSCDGDPEKLAGLAVLISMASFALGYVQASRDKGCAEAHTTALEQVRAWNAAVDEIHRQISRARQH